MKNLLTFPVSLLKNYLPHRPPMLWIDEVLWIREDEGECRVSLRKEAHYFDEEGMIRPSSLVEWMAQGYGFVRACQILNRQDEGLKKPEKTYLAAISDVAFHENCRDVIKPGGDIRIHIRTVRELGPLMLVQADIRTEKTNLASGHLKVYGA